MTQIKSWKTDKVLFEYEGTIKETVEEGIRQGINFAFADFRGADLNYVSLKYAYLKYANLEGANLLFADLNGADLRGANLKDANLKGAYLMGANLSGADFNKADLSSANLNYADLRYASLRGANLNGANIKYTNIHDANLSGADLKRANLRYSDFRDSDLNSANLKGADLYGAVLRFAKNIPDDFMPLACPAKGSFIAWKKVDDKLVKLEIPEEAKRSSATTKKCRCNKAKVLAITDFYETESFDKVINNNYASLAYRVGEMVYPDSFDEYRWNECSHGIHFFMDKEDALNW